MKDNENNQTENEQKGLKKFWEKRSPKNKFYLKVMDLFLFAFFIAFAYYFIGSVLGYEMILKEEGRNVLLLFFAVFGGGLAVWGRNAMQTQLENTERQLENSAEINRNDRFAKAVELLGKKGDNIASKGGLYMLRDLAHESPNTEYIRCVEIISYWLLQHRHTIGKDNLLNTTVEIFKIKTFNAELENIIKEYRKDNNLSYWPYLDDVKLEGVFLMHANLHGASLEGAYLENTNLRDSNLEGADMGSAKLQKVNLQNADLRGANLRGADLRDASLEGAKLEGANLEDADLTNTYMKRIRCLTKEQILSAKWKVAGYSGKPPQLPPDLMKDPDVQEWLSKPTIDKARKSKN